MAKGASQQSQKLLGQQGGYATQMEKNQGADRSSLFPFLTSELNNPEGFGQTAIDQMLTQGGQAVSGATGAAKEAATLNASRTGNTAAVPGIIDATARSAMKQQSNNALDVNIKNAMLKEQQRQDAAKAIGGLYSADQGSALKAMGLQDESLGEWTNADKLSPNAAFGNSFLSSLGSGLGKEVAMA